MYQDRGRFGGYLGTVFGTRNITCNRKRLEVENGVKYLIFEATFAPPVIRCPKCGKRLVKNGTKTRTFTLGRTNTFVVKLELVIQRRKCNNKDCKYDQLDHIPFADEGKSYTHGLETCVCAMLLCSTIQDTADYFGLSWNTVKTIHTKFLKRHFKSPEIKGVTRIGIDEFAIQKGHKYMTIVVDLDTRRIIYVGETKAAEALTKFWKRVKRLKVDIQYVSMDLSQAYIKAVRENCPNAVIVFDHFHVIQLATDAADDVRKRLVRETKGSDEKSAIKGLKYLILRNKEELIKNDPNKYATLEEALKANEDLNKAYYIKEELRDALRQRHLCGLDTPEKRAAAEVVLQNAVKNLNAVIEKCLKSNVEELTKLGETLEKHKAGILAMVTSNVSNGIVEGINNKIKVLKRTAYGFRDKEYFTLRLHALHLSKEKKYIAV